MRKLILLLLLSAGVKAQKINPVQIGINKVADSINVTVLSFKTTDKKCQLYYQVFNSIKKKIDEDNLWLTESEFTAWSDDNKYIENLALNKLGLTRKQE